MLSLLNNYVCMATKSASSATEMKAVCDVAKAYYESQNTVLATDSSTELPGVKIGSTNASRTQIPKDPVVLYRQAGRAREQLESFLSIYIINTISLTILWAQRSMLLLT